MHTDIISMIRNPLAQNGSTGSFLRLILAEAGAYGMPPDIIARLDDVAALLGFYKPTPHKQAGHLAAPLVLWRTDPEQEQSGIERVHEVECLAFKQRALIAFGGGVAGQMVGTAEIVVALGNTIKGSVPPEYYDIYQWASLDVLKLITGDAEEQILADSSKKGWRRIADEEVLRPGARLYATYQQIATSIRREAIARIELQANHPRLYLRPVAAHIIESHQRMRIEAIADGLSDIVDRLDIQIGIIKGMFPDLRSLEVEMADWGKVEQATAP